MEPDANIPDPYDYNPADAGSDRPANGNEVPAADRAGAPARSESEVRDPSLDADEVPPISGIVGVLDRIPRDCPQSVWANMDIPATDGDPNPMTEVGALVARRELVKALDALGAKVPAAHLDALLAMIGYALSVTTHHLVLTAARFAADEASIPAPVSASYEKTASRFAALDGEVLPVVKLSEALARMTNGRVESAADRRASRTAHGIMAGCRVMGLIARADANLAHASSFILAATINDLISEMEGGEGGDDEKRG